MRAPFVSRLLFSVPWLVVVLELYVPTSVRTYDPSIMPVAFLVSRSRDFKAAVEAGGYHHIDSACKVGRFPISGGLTHMVDGKIVCFHRPLEDHEVDVELDKLGLMRADCAEFFAFGADHPRLLLCRRIAAGVFWVPPEGGREYLILTGTWQGHRFVGARHVTVGAVWGATDCILAVPKDTPRY